MDNDDRDVRYLHIVGTANRQEQAEKEDGPPAPPAPNEASKAPTLFADRHSRNEPIPLAQRVLQIHWSKESDITNAMSALSVSTGSRFSGMTSHRSNSSLTTKRSLLSRSGRTISLDSMRWDSTNSRELLPTASRQREEHAKCGVAGQRKWYIHDGGKCGVEPSQFEYFFLCFDVDPKFFKGAARHLTMELYKSQYL